MNITEVGQFVRENIGGSLCDDATSGILVNSEFVAYDEASQHLYLVIKTRFDELTLLELKEFMSNVEEAFTHDTRYGEYVSRLTIEEQPEPGRSGALMRVTIDLYDRELD